MPKNWWLLVICAVLLAVISFIEFGHSETGFRSMRDVVLAGRLTIAAGACMIGAAVWGRVSALLAASGAALIGLGTLLSGVLGSRIGLRAIALLILVSAVTLGLAELEA